MEVVQQDSFRGGEVIYMAETLTEEIQETTSTVEFAYRFTGRVNEEGR